MDTVVLYPQFHMQPDDFFEMVHPTAGNLPTLSQWKHISIFKIDKPHHIHTQEGWSGSDPVIPDQDKEGDI